MFDEKHHLPKGHGNDGFNPSVEDQNLADMDFPQDTSERPIIVESTNSTHLRPSPNDPLNWSSRKKNTILAILSLSAFLGDFSSGAGIPLLSSQSQTFTLPPSQILYATNLNVLLVGIGGVLWIPPLHFWGRAPVLFWSTLIGTVFTLVCAIAPNFGVYYGARALVGVSLTAGQTIGLVFIKEMWEFEDQVRKLNFWYACFTASPYFGPMIGGFMVDGLDGNWRAVFWLIFALCCLDLVLILLFADETYGKELERGRRIWRVLGLWQIPNHGTLTSVKDSLIRLWKVLISPMVVPCMLIHAMQFMWGVGVNLTSSILFATPVEDGGYGYATKQVGFLYFTPVVAVWLGEAFGHVFNDWIARRYIRKHSGTFRPEVRLWILYIGAILMVPGLVVVGQALGKRLSVAAVIMGWGMYVFGGMLSGVSLTAFLMNKCPGGTGEISSFLNFARTIGGFSLGYYQQSWGAAVGYGASFGTQAAIAGLATIMAGLVHLICSRA
ncbi:Efflux pump radE [Pseudocercospora fuligena]|uniref:Efflux pump radE n=1 Tax=Pseudocercospora fuligena TaxID=685502 RepID=A0A8H6VH79_9PEZI|nr:Efflux pump radE [Pseudocercospora fuligena]